MGKKRTTNHHESATFQQLWNDLGSKLIQAAQEQLSLNQQVQGSSPWRLISGTESALSSDFNHQKPQKDQLIELIDGFSENHPENGQALAKGVILVYNIHGGFSLGYYILS